MAETSNDEPLEPDAGNADEGRSEPDWHLSHAIFRAWFFVAATDAHRSSQIRKNGPRIRLRRATARQVTRMERIF